MVALGGWGEVGMNCLVLEAEGRLLLLDCGALFADRDRGVDVVLPDLGWLLEHREALIAVLLTHGHEDHVGALPALLRACPVPVWGPRYALEVVTERAQRALPCSEPDLRELPAGQRVELGPFSVLQHSVAHSIPDARATVLHTPAGVLVHSGDFQLDDGFDRRFGVFDAEALEAVGRAGVRLLLSDSTNALLERPTAREMDARTALHRHVASATRRVVVALFASNVQRMAAAIEAGLAAGRKVCLLGRSMQRHAEIATHLGLLHVPAEAWVRPEHLGRLPPERLLVLATGTQGEPPAALTRLAHDTHPDLSLEAGDLVLLSSRIIPGHERRVFEMVDTLERRGVRVLHRGLDPNLHASGHATRSEQRALIRLLRPEAFVPVHGGAQQLRLHAELARAEGVPDTLVAYDGQVVEVPRQGPLRLVGRVPTGRVPLHAGEPLGAEVLDERARLGARGLAAAVVAVDPRGFPVGPVRILASGVLPEGFRDTLLQEAAEHVSRAAREFSEDLDTVPLDALEEHMSHTLARFLRRHLGRRPSTRALALPVHTEVSP